MMAEEGTDLNVGDIVQEQECSRRKAVIQRQKRGSGRDAEERMWVFERQRGRKRRNERRKGSGTQQKQPSY